MNGQEEVDEFGIPIKKKAPEKKQEVDEYGIPIKKKDDTGKPSATGTPTTSPLPLKSLSPAEKRRRLQEAAQGLGGKTPSTEIDVEINQKRRELPRKTEISLNPLGVENQEVQIPLPDEEIRLQQPVLDEGMPRRDLTMPSDIAPVQLPPDAPIIKPEDVKTGEKTAIDVAKEKFPQPIPKEEQMLSEEIEAVGGEIQQIGTEMQLGTTFEELPKGEAVIKPPKFKENPDGTQRISDDYYGLKREEGGKLVFDATEKTPATTNERLAAQGFYYNPQNKKKGEFNLFDGSPDMLFQKYEPEIVDYLRTLESTSPDIYKNIQSKIEAGNFTQQDQFNIISEIEGKKALRLRQDLEIAAARIEAIQIANPDLMLGEDVLQEGTGLVPQAQVPYAQELPPEAQELAAYIQEKLPQLEEASIQLEALITNYPVLAEKQWEQEVLTKRWEETDVLSALPIGLAIGGIKTGNMINNTLNSTGQFLYRAVGANETANSWNNFWEAAVQTTPEMPIVITNPDGSTSIDWANAVTEILPQLTQMSLVFGKMAGAYQTGAKAIAGGEISKNTGLLVSGYMATYKDLYDQAKAANLSNDDAHIYASIVGMGVAGAEIIMPDRNFFASGSDAILQHTIREVAKGSTGKALVGSISTFVKNTFKEEVEEFTQDLISNASAVMADGIMDGANFDAQLFDKEGIMTTAIVTGLTAGLAGSGKLVGDLKQRNRDLYALSQNYENFQTQLQTLVETEQVTPEQAERLVQEVEALRVAETKVPPTMPVEQKATVVPLVAEKEQLVEEKKELDPVFHAPIDQRIEEIDNEILTETKQKEDAVQVEKAGQVPVQPETGGGQEVQGGPPKTEPQKVTEQVVEEKVVEETPVQKELTPEQNKQNELVAEIKGYNELTPAKRRTKDGSQRATRIGQLAQDLGFDLQTDKKSGRFKATNNSGKKVISVSVKEEVAEPREEDITFTKQQIDEGAFNWSGQAYDPKIDLGLPWADIKKGIADIKKGVMSVPAKRVANAMRKVQEDGGYTVKTNIAGEKIEVFIPLGENLYEEVSREQEEEYAQMYDAWFDSLSPEQKEAEVYFTEYGEDTETEPDQIAEGEALDADTEGSTTETGTEQKVTPDQEAKAKEYGYANPFQAVASVNKFTGKEYTVADFDTIPDSEFKKASEQSETVKKNKATEAKLADIQARRQSIKERLAEKIKEGRGEILGSEPRITLADIVSKAGRKGASLNDVMSGAKDIGVSQREIQIAEPLYKAIEKSFKDVGLLVGSLNTSSGRYFAVEEIIQLAESGREATTLAHEMLHHAEKHLPQKARSVIAEARKKAIAFRLKEAANPLEATLNKLRPLTAAQRAFLESVQNAKTQAEAYESFRVLNEKEEASGFYQFTTPSEFWAENASEILESKVLYNDKSLKDAIIAFIEAIIEFISGPIFGRKDIAKVLDDVIKGRNEAKLHDYTMSSEPTLYQKNDKKGGVPNNIKQDLIELGATYIEEGVVKAKDFVARMRADMKELGIDDSKITDEDITGQIFDKTKPKQKEGGVKKTVATIRAYEGEFREGVKKELEKLGLTREIGNQQEAKKKALAFVEKVGEDAALEAVRNYDIQGAQAAYVWNHLIEWTEKQLSKENTPEQQAYLESLEAKLIDEFGKQALLGGQFNAALADIYANSDLGYNVEAKINEYKAITGGEISPEVEEKFRDLGRQLKEVSKKLAQAEEKLKEAEQNVDIKNIQESIERDKKKTFTQRARVAANNFRKLKTKPPVFRDANGNEIRIETQGITWNDLVEIGAKAIEKTGIVADGITAIINVINTQDWFKKLDGKGKASIIQQVENHFKSNAEVKVPNSLIRDLVARGIDNINDLVLAVQEEIPTATEREIRDAITGYGRTVSLNQGDIETRLRRMKRIGRALSALEDIAQKIRPVRSGLQRDKLDAEERALLKQLREEMKNLPEDEETLANELRTILDSQKQRARNRIEELQREIDKNERIPRVHRTAPLDAELADLKQQLEEVKKKHDEIFNTEQEQEQKRLVQTKNRTKQAIENLQERLKNKDFAKRQRKVLTPDSELIKLRAEKLRIKEEFDKEVKKAELLNRTTRQRVIDSLWEAWGLTRALQATGEFSFMLIQGGIQTLAHPRNAIEGIKNALKLFSSERRGEEFIQRIKAEEWYPIAKQAKLALTDPNADITAREELFFSGWTNTIWNAIGMPFKFKSQEAHQRWVKLNPFKAVERAAVGYLDTIRILRFLDGMEILAREGKTIESHPQDFKDVADAINTLTGRASIGPLEQVSSTLTKVFFSPRNWSSVMKTSTPYALYHFGKMTPTARKMAVSDFAKFVGITTAMVMMAAAYLNNDDDDETGVELDPRSSDFGKIKLGKKRIDPWGGRSQMIVMQARVMLDALGFGAYKSSTGEISRLGVYGKSPTKGDVLRQIAINKLSPSASMLNKYLSTRIRNIEGEEMRFTQFGEPYSLSEELSESWKPIFTGTVKDLLKDDPTALDGLLIFYAFLGGGVNVYDDKPGTIIRNDIKDFMNERTITISKPSRLVGEPGINDPRIYLKDGTSRPLTKEEFTGYIVLYNEKLNELSNEKFDRMKKMAEGFDKRGVDKKKAERELQKYFTEQINSKANKHALEIINDLYGDERAFRRAKIKDALK